MQIANSPQQYGLISQILHWGMAGMMLAMLFSGLYMTGLENGVVRDYVYMLHKTAGVTLLILALLRLVWTRCSPRPELHNTIEGWQRKLARWVHKILFFMIFAVPISGLGMNFFRGAVLEYIVPLNNPSDPFLPLMYFFGAFHKFLFPALLIIMVGLHVLGLLKHLVVDGDGNALRRMFGTITDKKEP